MMTIFGLRVYGILKRPNSISVHQTPIQGSSCVTDCQLRHFALTNCWLLAQDTNIWKKHMEIVFFTFSVPLLKLKQPISIDITVETITICCYTGGHNGVGQVFAGIIVFLLNPACNGLLYCE